MNNTEHLLQQIRDSLVVSITNESYVVNYEVSGGSTIFNSDKQEIDCGDMGTYSFQIISTGLDAANSKIILQDSNDKSNWIDMVDNFGTEASVTLPSGSDISIIRVFAIASKYVRIRFDVGAATSGTIDISFFGKSR